MRRALGRMAVALAALACAHCDPVRPVTDAGATPLDAGLDADDTARDTGVDADASAPCIAADAYSPRPFVAPHAPATSCTFDEIDGYFTACLEQPGATPIRCQQFTAAHTACAQCILPPPSSPEAGVLRTIAGALDVNVGGCIALLLGDSLVTGCGAREEAAGDCQRAACAACEKSDVSCLAQAREGICRELELRRCAELAGASVCTLDRPFGERFRMVAQVFCSAADR